MVHGRFVFGAAASGRTHARFLWVQEAAPIDAGLGWQRRWLDWQMPREVLPASQPLGGRRRFPMAPSECSEYTVSWQPGDDASCTQRLLNPFRRGVPADPPLQRATLRDECLNGRWRGAGG